MLQGIIIDDDQSCIDTLQEMLQYYALPVNITAKATTLAKGIELLQNNHIDLLFLDIEIGRNNGFEIFETFPQPDFKIIFTTGHREYALQAIKASCLDYLVKPIDGKELCNAIEKANQQKQFKAHHQQIEALLSHFNANEEDKKIALSTNTSFEILRAGDILYCEADSSYSHVYLVSGKKFTISKTLKDLEEVLPNALFFRCHKSFLINMKKIERLLKQDGMQVCLQGNIIVDVSIRKKEELMNLFKRL